MKIKKTWISPGSGRHSLHILAGIPGIVLLMTAFIIGGMLLSFRMDWPREIFSVILCLGATALGVSLALRLGRRTVQDVSVFFLAENDRLFVLDARRLSHYGHGLTGYIDGTLQTQELLRRLTEMCDVPAGADEILSVERIRENKSHYIFLCRTRCSGRGTDRRTCFLVKGDPDEEELLLQMERRRNLNSIPESAADRSLSAVLISFLTLAGFIILCVLSHPAVDRLPQFLYFPCLIVTFLAFFLFIYFIIRYRRGE